MNKEEKFVCPYHKPPKFNFYKTIDDLNNHMTKFHWQGLDLHFKPSNEEFYGKYEA